MTSAVEIRPFEERDTPAVLDLLRDALGETELLRRSPALFAWKHFDNPFGRSLMLVAQDRQGIVGFRAFMRWELNTADGEVLRCARPVDTATHARGRRQGIFRRLTEAAVESARGEGVELIFNTPNAHSRPGYLRMGWQEVGRIGVMIRPLGFKSKSAYPFPQVRDASRWGEREPHDRRPLGLRTPRRVGYLKWRFSLHPTARYYVTESTPDGSLAVLRSNVRKGRGELVVSDLFGVSAWSAVRQAARSSDAAYIVGWASRHVPERRQLRSAGLVSVPGLTALRLVALPLAVPGTDVTRLSSWDMTLSDLELL